MQKYFGIPAKKLFVSIYVSVWFSLHFFKSYYNGSVVSLHHFANEDHQSKIFQHNCVEYLYSMRERENFQVNITRENYTQQSFLKKLFFSGCLVEHLVQYKTIFCIRSRERRILRWRIFKQIDDRGHHRSLESLYPQSYSPVIAYWFFLQCIRCGYVPCSIHIDREKKIITYAKVIIKLSLSIVDCML